MYGAVDISRFWSRQEWLVGILEEAKLEDCPGKSSLYWLSQLPFLTVLFCCSPFSGIARILIKVV